MLSYLFIIVTVTMLNMFSPGNLKWEAITRDYHFNNCCHKWQLWPWPTNDFPYLEISPQLCILNSPVCINYILSFVAFYGNQYWHFWFDVACVLHTITNNISSGINNSKILWIIHDNILHKNRRFQNVFGLFLRLFILNLKGLTSTFSHRDGLKAVMNWTT